MASWLPTLYIARDLSEGNLIFTYLIKNKVTMAFYLGKYCPGSGRDATYKPDEKDDSLGLPYRGACQRR